MSSTRATRSSADAQHAAAELAEQQRRQTAAAEAERKRKASAKKKGVRAEGAADTDGDVQMQTEIAVAPAHQQALQQPAAGDSALRDQMAALMQIVQDQQQQLKQLRASPVPSPLPSAQPSPQQSPRTLSAAAATATAAAAAAAVAVAAPAPARRKDPRLSDLAEYNGAGGEKLDAWLAELRRCARYYQLSGADAAEFAVARLRDAADTWWADELTPGEQAAIGSVDALAAAMRARFQPVTTARVAREKLHALQQNSRHVDEYIAEFSKLRAQVADMAEPDARAQFMRGLRRELAIKLEDVDWESMPLAALIAKAARIGGRSAAAQPAAGRSSANQMDVDDGNGSAGRLDRIEAALNALSSGGGGAGLGAKTQTQRGYQQERGDGAAAGRGGFRGGRFGGVPRGPPVVPGVPADTVKRRYDAKQCVRCGGEDHRSPACPNAISASGK
jgi:Retrotransposon gag protein